AEASVTRLVLAALGGSLLASLGLAVTWVAGGPRHVILGTWWRAGGVRADLAAQVDGPGVALSLLAACWLLIGARAAVTYLHREPGYARFQALLCVFAAGMQLVALGGSLLLMFVGWELLGVSSALLIGWRFQRRDSTLGGLRALLTNRVGDAAFVLAMAVAWSAAGTVDLEALAAGGLAAWQAGLTFGLLTIAAAAKAGQLPFSPWLSRSIEGPTLSSALFYAAVMVHAGPFLLVRAAPLASRAPSVMVLPVTVGLVTVGYGWLVSITQPDVKGAYVHASMSQVGVSFALAGAGWTEVAMVHLVGHSALRGWQLMTAPSFREQVGGLAAPEAPAWLRARPALQVAASARLWMDEAHDDLVVQPARRLARDLAVLDAAVLDPISELPEPAERPASSLALWEAGRTSGRGPAEPRGLVARVLGWSVELAYGVEERFVLPLFGSHLPRFVRALGRIAAPVEAVMAEAWFAPAVVLLTLALVMEGR
ncbi:MAG TPA: proton-conducting transporter membrane subunit, partial [Myxococcota bacterium]|nr:proton-conducting transporter membrane subunit [Myxococcota bacterium]